MYDLPSKVIFLRFKEFYRLNFSFVSLCITFIISLVISPFLLYINEVRSVAEMIAQFTLSLNAGHFIYVFLFYFLIYLIFTVPVFLNGLSVSGYIISYIYTAVLAALVGVYSGYFYSQFGVAGFMHCLAVVFPSVLIFIISYILGSRESYLFSKMMCKAFSPDEKCNFYSDFKLYCLRFVFILCLLIVSALIFALCAHFIKII